MKTSTRFLETPPAAPARTVALTLPADEAAPEEASGGLLRGLLGLALLPVLLAVNLAWLASDAICFRAARRKGAGRTGR
ncbi:MAG: hypothetical protein L6R28_15130 [Planctomycetes bacterium]|nr:hypothetical protein [Planctomycetota bacterium]